MAIGKLLKRFYTSLATFATLGTKGTKMPEISSAAAAEIIGTTSQTIRRTVDRQLLSARRTGLHDLVKVDVEELRHFAEQYQYRFDETLTKRCTK